MLSQEFNAMEYIQQTSKLLNMQIQDEYQNGVINNLQIIQQIAEMVNQFSLPEEIEISPVFEP